MAAEWKEIWTLASAMIARQPPPIQIVVGLCAAFVALMVVEGLRASFLPRRLQDNPRPREPRCAEEPADPSNAAQSKPTFARSQRFGVTRYRKVEEATPRRHQAFRPKIRRVSASFEMSHAGIREPRSDLNDQALEPLQFSQSDDQLPAFRQSDLLPATEI